MPLLWLLLYLRMGSEDEKGVSWMLLKNSYLGAGLPSKYRSPHPGLLLEKHPVFVLPASSFKGVLQSRPFD